MTDELWDVMTAGGILGVAISTVLIIVSQQQGAYDHVAAGAMTLVLSLILLAVALEESRVRISSILYIK